MAGSRITISQGCDYDLTVMIENADGTPKDLTGYTARFRVANKKLDARYISLLGSTNEVEAGFDAGFCNILNPTAGEIRIEVNPHNKERLPTNNEIGEESKVKANNIFSIVIIDDTGKITKIAQGDCLTQPEL